MKKTLLLLMAVLAAAFDLTAASPTGTLPVISIDTRGGVEITSKTEYVAAAFSVTPNGAEGVEAVADSLQIRGRGNYTWVGFDKKPFRIKLYKKTPLLGMKKSKHFALLAHADDNLGFLREPLGFALSRLTGLAWTPDMRPVELVVNGDYRGLYFLVETIRVDPDRVNITDQADAPGDVSGGWLCEIDNYDDEEQIKLTEGNGSLLRVTHKSPEGLTDEQRQFLTSQIKALDAAFYMADPASRDYEKLVDLESLAAFYLIQELMDNQESFHGSCYFYRDRGADAKWFWGPVWDFGNAYMRPAGKFMYQDPLFGQTWIEQINKFDTFRSERDRQFARFLDGGLDAALAAIDDFAARIAVAARADAARWPNYANADVAAKAAEIKSLLNNRVKWLASKWGFTLPGRTDIYLRGTHSGWATDEAYCFTTVSPGVYELRDVTLNGEFKIADPDWGTVNWGGAVRNETPAPDTAHPLVAKGQNLYASGHFTRLILRVADDNSSATLEMSTRPVESGVAGPEAEAAVIVSGRHVTASRPVDIIAPDGRIVASGVAEITLAPGIYIIDGRKFAIR